MRLRPGLAALTLLAFGLGPSHALPETAETLRQILARGSGGDAMAYIDTHEGAFRRMACEGRSDLIGVLRASGLDPDALDSALHASAVACTLRNTRPEALDLLLTPLILARMEEATRTYPQDQTPLRLAAEEDDRRVLLALLLNGASLWEPDEPLRSALSRDGHILLAAHYAHTHQRSGLLGAISGAGFDDSLADAAIPGFAELVAETAHLAGQGGALSILTFIELPGPARPVLPVIADLAPLPSGSPGQVAGTAPPVRWEDLIRYLRHDIPAGDAR